MMADMYLVYLECQRKLDACLREETSSEEELIVEACAVCVEALRETAAVMLHNLHELYLFASSGAEEVVSFARDAEAQHLAGHLATRISLSRNKRLAKALDDIRAHNKRTSQERFESLLRELYVLSPEIWAEHHVTDWQLQVTRGVVVIRDRAAPNAAGGGDRAGVVPRPAKAPQAGPGSRLPARRVPAFCAGHGDRKSFLRNGKLNHRRPRARRSDAASGTVKQC
jgi:hypothetical protein